MEEIIYIYDLNQARYFIKQGLKIYDIGIHTKTRNPYWVFDKTQSNFEQIFQQWLTQKQYVW